MQRRTVLKGAAAGIGAVGIGTVALSGGAAAEIGEYDLSAEEINGLSDDGTLDEIRVWVEDGTIGYQGLEDPAGEATIELQIVYDNTAETVDSTTLTAISGQSRSDIEFDRLEGDVLDHPDLAAEDFEATEDGTTVENEDVDLRLAVTVTTEADDDVTGETTDNLRIVMENVESAVDGEGSADGEIVTNAWPSTNGENEANSDPHVELVESGEGSVTLEFHNPYDYLTYFEYRVDGEFVAEDWNDEAGDREDYPHQTVDVNENYDVISGDAWNAGNYDPANRDLQHVGVYPQNGNSVEKTFEGVGESVEVRLALGGDRSHDFDWVAFYPA